jgi:hypothetical protein
MWLVIWEKKIELAEIMFIDEIDHINEISNLDEMIIWMKLYIYL